MNTEDITEAKQIGGENIRGEVDTLVEPIGSTYGQIQALCNELSQQSKLLAIKANELLTQATDLYDEAKRLTPNYKPPKNNNS